MKYQFKTLALSLTLIAGAVTTLVAYAASDIPFVVSAYNVASTESQTSRVSTEITLKNNGAILATASGKLAKKDDLLVGMLPMNVTVPAIANKGEHRLNFSLSKTGRIGLQWIMDKKPYGGHEMKYFDADVTGDTLTKEVVLSGMRLQLTLTLKRDLLFLKPVPMRTFRPGVLPTLTPPRIIADRPMKFVTPIPMKRKALGRTLIVEPRFVITNSYEGPTDKKIEIDGKILLGNWQIFNFNSKSVQQGESFAGRRLEFYDEYGPVNKAMVALSGAIVDKDPIGADDPVWNSQMVLDLRSIANGSGEFKIEGDGNNESADLYIKVIKGAERFE